MTETLLLDGARFILWTPENEKQLQNIVTEHYKDIFGEYAIYFDFEPRLRSTAGIGSKPDGCVIILSAEPKWVVIETELSTHPLYEHIIPQISRFTKALENPETRAKIVNAFYERISKDPFKKALLERSGVGREIYKFLNEVVSKKPSIAIIIEKKTRELDEVLGTLPLKQEVVELRTFEREGVGLRVHAHLFEPIVEEVPPIHEVSFPDDIKTLYPDYDDNPHSAAMLTILYEKHKGKNNAIHSYELSGEMKNRFPLLFEGKAVGKISFGNIFAGSVLKRKGLIKIDYDDEGHRLYWVP